LKKRQQVNMTQAVNAETSETPRTPQHPISERFFVLDGLRGTAAIAVILDHVPAHSFLPGRALSVDLFFVLSGFVLAHAYGKQLSARLSPLEFLKLRLVRLYPLYLLGLLLALPIAAHAAVTGTATIYRVAGAVLFGVFMMPKPPLTGWQTPLYPLNGPAWSLFYELLANLVYARVARLLTVGRLAAMLPFGAAMLWFTATRHSDVSGPGWLWSHADSGVARVMYGFFAGVLIYRLRSIWRAPVMPAGLSILLFLAIISVPASDSWRPAFEAIAAIVIIPLIVMLSTHTELQVTTAKVCTTFGRLSYGVYMLHVPLLGILNFVVERLGLRLPDAVLIALLIGLAGGFATLADRLYDGPARRWLSRHLVGYPRTT
jgi:peptidoglycan/LPS O-acetylase OafA/YrhL